MNSHHLERDLLVDTSRDSCGYLVILSSRLCHLRVASRGRDQVKKCSAWIPGIVELEVDNLSTVERDKGCGKRARAGSDQLGRDILNSCLSGRRVLDLEAGSSN
jgi:hypothetical protein